MNQTDKITLTKIKDKTRKSSCVNARAIPPPPHIRSVPVWWWWGRGTPTMGIRALGRGISILPRRGILGAVQGISAPPWKGHGTRGWGNPPEDTWDQRLGPPPRWDMGPEAGVPPRRDLGPETKSWGIPLWTDRHLWKHYLSASWTNWNLSLLETFSTKTRYVTVFHQLFSNKNPLNNNKVSHIKWKQTRLCLPPFYVKMQLKLHLSAKSLSSPVSLSVKESWD